jgi:hypothetical protein
MHRRLLPKSRHHPPHYSGAAGAALSSNSRHGNLDDGYQAKEAFLTSTTKRVMPVVQIDDVVLGTGKPGPVTMALLQALLQMEEQQRQTLVVI